MNDRSKVPGLLDKAWPAVFTTVPPPVKEKKPGQLPHSQIQQFFHDGYTVVRDFFTREELDPCRRDIEMNVEQLAQRLYKAGKVNSLYSECGLFQRLTKLEEDFEGANVLLHKWWTITPAFLNLWSNERLLNVVEQIIGPEIAGHPALNLRPKSPGSESGILPWHQDSAYFSVESYDHVIATAWVPFLDATPENGCMEMAKGGHRRGKVGLHTGCFGGTWYVMLDDKEMIETLGVDMKRDVKVEPVNYGSFVLFHNLTPHRSLPNVSNDVRWSADLRWQSPHQDFGTFGIQKGVLMRSPDRPQLQPDWDAYLKLDRKKAWKKNYTRQEEPGDQKVDAELDTRMTGPWMGKWPIVHPNRHTLAYQPQMTTA